MNPPCYDDAQHAVQVCIVYPGPSWADQLADWATLGAMSLIMVALVLLTLGALRGMRNRKDPPHDNG